MPQPLETDPLRRRFFAVEQRHRNVVSIERLISSWIVGLSLLSVIGFCLKLFFFPEIDWKYVAWVIFSVPVLFLMLWVFNYWKTRLRVQLQILDQRIGAGE